MRVRIANNHGTLDISVQTLEQEAVEDMSYLNRAMPDIMEAFGRVMERWPVFSQVTLDTMTDEERRLIEVSQTKAELS